MDDPWGSPWATGDNLTLPPTIAPPRPTLHKIPSFTTQSPWGDTATIEDDFGDWAGADAGLATPAQAARSSPQPQLHPDSWLGDGWAGGVEARLTAAREAARRAESEHDWLGTHSPLPVRRKSIGRAERGEHASRASSTQRDPWRESDAVDRQADATEEANITPSTAQSMNRGPTILRISPDTPKLHAAAREQLSSTTIQTLEFDEDDLDDGPKQALDSPTTSIDDAASPKTSLEKGVETDAAHAASPIPLDRPQVSAEVVALREKAASVRFAPDLANVGKLFSHITQRSTTSSNSADTYIPDSLPHDSFATMSQRTTWYRISRNGSSRRHASGLNDDEYRWVLWPTSQIREDTLKIARRWREEDSFNLGRTTLGGGAAKGGVNVFGWDSKDEPLSLAEVYGRSRGVSNAADEVLNQPGSNAKPSFKSIELKHDFGWANEPFTGHVPVNLEVPSSTAVSTADDLSMAVTGPSNSRLTQGVPPAATLSVDDQAELRKLVATLPDLSYMLR